MLKVEHERGEIMTAMALATNQNWLGSTSFEKKRNSLRRSRVTEFDMNNDIQNVCINGIM